MSSRKLRVSLMLLLSVLILSMGSPFLMGCTSPQPVVMYKCPQIPELPNQLQQMRKANHLLAAREVLRSN